MPVAIHMVSLSRLGVFSQVIDVESDSANREREKAFLVEMKE